MQAARKTPRIQKKAEMAQEHLEEVRAQERQEMAREHLEEVRAQERQEMVRKHLAGCRRKLPERMLARRRQTDSRREEMAACRAIRRRAEQKITAEERRAEMAA